MDKRSKNMAKRIFAALLAVMLVSGTAVMTPVYKNITTGVVANALTGSAEDFNIFGATTFEIDGEAINGETEKTVPAKVSHTVTVAVKDGEDTLTLGTDYKIYVVENGGGKSESNGTVTVDSGFAGELEIFIEGIGTYEGAQTEPFTLKVGVDVTGVVSGEGIEPEVGNVITSDSSFLTNSRIKIIGGTYGTLAYEGDGLVVEPMKADFVMDDFVDWEYANGEPQLPQIYDDGFDSLLGIGYRTGKDGANYNAQDSETYDIFKEVYCPYVDGDVGEGWLVVDIEETDGIKTYVLQGYNVPLNIKSVTVAKIPAQPYADGEKITPELTVVDRATDPADPYELEEGVDYRVEYTKNIYAGTAEATIYGIGSYYGKIEKTFEIMAKYDFSAVVNDDQYTLMVKESEDNDAADIELDENGCAYLAKYNVIYSNAKLTFSSPQQVTPALVENYEFNGETYYEYTVKLGRSNSDSSYNVVSAEHKHKYVGHVPDNGAYMYIDCGNEINSPKVTAAMITIPNDTYKYGEKIDVRTKRIDDISAEDGVFYEDNNYGITNNDVKIYDNIVYYPKNDDTAFSSVTPTTDGTWVAMTSVEMLGEYKLEMAGSIRIQFDIIKKPISDENIKLSFTVDDKKIEEGGSVEYNRKEREPGVVLTYKGFFDNADPNAGQCDLELVEGTDYTVTYTPIKAKDVLLNDNGEVIGYHVKVEAVKDDNGKYTGNYTGSREFNWYIQKQDAKAVIEDNVEFVYGEATAEGAETAATVDTDKFGLTVTAADPTEENANNLYNLIEGADKDYTVAYTYTKADGTPVAGVPVAVGDYKVTATFTSGNYNIKPVTAEFSIVRREVTVTPSAYKKTYTEAKAEDTIEYVLSNVVAGDEGLFTEGEAPIALVLVDGTNNSAGVLNAGTYNYKFNEEYVHAVVAEPLDAGAEEVISYEFDDNYKLSLVNTTEIDGTETALNFVVDPKEITSEMFSIEDTIYNRAEQNANTLVTGSDKVNEVEYMNVGGTDFVLSGDITATEANANPSNAAYKNGYVVTVTAQRNYTGTLTDGNALVWMIEQADITRPENEADDRFTVVTTDMPYSARAQEPAFLMTDNITTPPTELNAKEEIVEYTVAEHEEFKEAGKHDFTIVGQGNYKGERTETFTITQTPADKVEFELIIPQTLIYDGTGMNGKYVVVAKNVVDAENPIEIVDPEDYATIIEWYRVVDGVMSNDALSDDEVISAGDYKAYINGSGTNYAAADEAVEWPKTVVINKRHTQIYPTDGQSLEYNSFDPNEVDLTYTMEAEDTVERRGVIAADRQTADGVEVYVNSQDNNASIDFGSALYVDFGTIPDNGVVNVGTYYIFINDDVLFDNYEIDGFDYEPEFYVTPKALRREMFDVTVVSGAQSVVIDGENYEPGSVVFSSSKVTAAVTEAKDGNLYMTEDKDFKVAGSTNVVAASQGTTYKVEIWGKGNYDKKSKVEFEYTVDKEDIEAQIVVNGKKYYDGEVMPVMIQSKDGTMLPAEVLSNVTYTYNKIDEEGNVIKELGTTAPVLQGKYKVTANVSSRNYNVAINPAIFRIVRELKNENLTINHTEIAAYDVGVANFGDVDLTFTFDGVVFELVEGVDYELYGDTTSNTIGSTHEVQVLGINNYEGVAAATWTVTDGGATKEQAIEDINKNVKFDFVKVGDDVDCDARLGHGKKRVQFKLTSDVPEGYKLVEQGVLYYNGEDYVEGETELTAKAAKSGSTYLVVDNGNGIHAKGYAVVQKIMSVSEDDPDDYNAYETTLYTDVFDTTYEEAEKFVATVTGGYVIGSSADRAVAVTNEDGDVIGYSVVYHGYDMTEGRKSISVEAPETIEVDGATKYFAHWLADGEIVSMIPQYSFIVRTREKNLEAVYVDSAEELVAAEPIVTLSASQTFVGTANAVMFTIGKSVPNGYNITEQGVIYTNNKGLGLSDTYGATTDLVDNGVLTEEQIINSLKAPAEGISVYKSSKAVSNNNDVYSKPVKVNSNVDAYLYAIGFIKVEGSEDPIYTNKLTITTFTLAN